MKRLLTIFVALMATVGEVIGQDTVRMSFREAVRTGLSQNIDYTKLRNQQDVLRMERVNAQLNHLPRIGVSSEMFRQIGQQFQQVEGELIVTNQVNDIVSGGVNANMPVFNGFRRIHTTQAMRQFEMAGENGLNYARQQVMFNIAQQYLQVLLDEELYKIAMENLENQKKQLEQIEGFVEAGLRTLADLYNQQSEVARLETVALNAKIQWETDLWQLAETLQLGPNTLPLPENVPLDDDGDSELLMLPLAELFQTAIAQRSDLRQQQLLESGSKKMLAASRSLHLPQLNAFFRYNTFFTSLDSRTFNDQFFAIYPQRTFGFSLNIPIFTAFDTRLMVSRSKVDFRNQQLDKTALERQIYQEVKLAYENFNAAIKREKATKLQLSAAEVAQAAIAERFKLGVSNFVDLAQANQQLVTAQSDFAQAQYTLYFQDIILRFTLGILEVGEFEG